MKNFKFISTFIWLVITTGILTGQDIVLEAYVFEADNRGYLNQVEIEVYEHGTFASIFNGVTDHKGFFTCTLKSQEKYDIVAYKTGFKDFEHSFTADPSSVKKMFLSIEMEREPGYDFEVTLAPKREDEDEVVDGIEGAWIEVYNNTSKKEILNIKNHPDKEFNVHFEKGNHYTIMVRKDGYFNKRMEAFVDVEGCILCFDGIGSVEPGVVDNLSGGNQFGVLLANVELEPLFSGRKFKVENIYYDFAKATLRPEAKASLRSLAMVLNDNPHVSVELGSHTDSRGTDDDNQKLSNARAKSAVDYLINSCRVSKNTIKWFGYGETELVNECTDSINCTEVQHQANRRTEIKITSVNESKKLGKPLRQIRVEEEFKRKLIEDGPETIQVEAKNNPSSSNDDASTEKINPELNIQQLTRIPKYIKYSIVIAEQDEAILPDSAQQFIDIIEYSPALDKYFYLVGEFNNEEEAVGFLEEKVKNVFPDAYVVQFRNGKRIK